MAGIPIITKKERAAELRGKKEGAFIPDPAMPRVILCNGGKNAYVLDNRSDRTWHLRTGTIEFDALLLALDDATFA